MAYNPERDLIVTSLVRRNLKQLNSEEVRKDFWDAVNDIAATEPGSSAGPLQGYAETVLRERTFGGHYRLFYYASKNRIVVTHFRRRDSQTYAGMKRPGPPPKKRR